MPHIQDVARRVALAGYVALAPDLMSATGGTPDDEDKARVEFAKVDLAVARKDAVAALAYLKSRPDVSGRVGAVGFCWSGGMVNFLATAVPDLGAGVVYCVLRPHAAARGRRQDQGAAAQLCRARRAAYRDGARL
ncbi:MAG TPA: dienelactone hydrolase family protein [Stellaceae bacterium]|jgi:carboxymethylenebutenolidase|nr:dienelactone hydrolase family protein [Stellaceae bacterium]